MSNRKQKKAVLHCQELETRLVPSCVMPPLSIEAINTMIGEQNAVMDLVPLANVTDEVLGGKWSDPKSWKSGVLPKAGANIEIDPGVAETYDLASSPAYNTIRVDGTLKFSQSVSTNLLVQTIVDMPTGDVEIVEPNPSVKATITFADTGPLDLVNDPKELGRGYLAVGLMNADGTMGAMATTNIQGAQKSGWFTIGGVAAGTSSLSFAVMPTRWQVGDKLLFNGTGAGSQDETVTITDISATSISFTPLQFNHLTPSTHTPPQVPVSPTNLAGTAADGQVALTWDALPGATSYNLYRSTTSDGETLYKSGVTTNSFTDTGLADGTTYYYWLTAVNPYGEGLRSGELASTPQAATGSTSPTGPTVKAGTWTINNGVYTQTANLLDDSKVEFTSPSTGVTQIMARMVINNNPGGDARFGVGLNNDPTSAYGWNLVLHNQTLAFLDDHVVWGNNIPFAYEAGKAYWLKEQVAGGILSGKVWLDGTPEPTGWMLLQKGWTDHSRGLVGLVGGTGATFNNVSIPTSMPVVTHAGIPPAPPPPPVGSVAQMTTVANLTRNIVFNSQNTSPLRAGHIMFMHTDQDTINYFEMDGLGRTDKSKILGATTTDTNGEVVTNVVGRYALHFHRLFNFSSDCRVDVVGDVVSGGPGWGFDNHSSNVNFTDNIDYGTYGAGFVTEAGDEIGSIHNLSVANLAGKPTNQNSTNAQDASDRAGANDFGTAGTGFWIQGSGYGISIENNVAAEDSQAGYYIFSRGLAEKGMGAAKTGFWTQNIKDAALLPAPGVVSVDPYTLPMNDFVGNSAYVSNAPIWLDATGRSNFHEHIDNFTAWGSIGNAIQIYYAQDVDVTHATLLSNNPTSYNSNTGIAVTFGYTSAVNYSDSDIEGFKQGVQLPGEGKSSVTNGYFDNLVNIYTTRTASGVDPTKGIAIQGNVTFGSRSHAAGGDDYFLNAPSDGNGGSVVSALTGHFFPNYVYVNTTDHPNSQLFYLSQAWNAPVFTKASNTNYTDGNFVDYQLAAFTDDVKGLTNGQMMTTYNLGIWGQAAPQNATALNFSNALIGAAWAPYQLDIAWPRYANSLSNYQLKYNDIHGNSYTWPTRFQLHTGWNFLPITFNNQTYTFMVYGDVTPPTLVLDPNQVLSVSLAQLSQPFTVRWTFQDNSQGPNARKMSKTFSDLLSFPLQTRPDGTQFIVITIPQKDSAGNETSLVVTINVAQ